MIRSVNTFGAVFQRFMEIEIIPNVDAWRNVDGVLRRHVLPHWCSTAVQDIRRSHIHDLIDEWSKRTNGTAREVRKHLSRFFNWVVDREIIADNPIHGFKRGDLHTSEEAGRALRDEEIKYIWHASQSLGYPFGPLYRLLLLTGQRRTEWAAASRSEITPINDGSRSRKLATKAIVTTSYPWLQQPGRSLINCRLGQAMTTFLFSSRNGKSGIRLFKSETSLGSRNRSNNAARKFQLQHPPLPYP